MDVLHPVPTRHRRSTSCHAPLCPRRPVVLTAFLRMFAIASLMATGPDLVHAQTQADPQALLREGDRLAWMKAWSKAGPVFEQARKEFATRGDRRNELYAAINLVRVDLPRLAVPEASQRLEEYLDDPLVERRRAAPSLPRDQGRD